MKKLSYYFALILIIFLPLQNLIQGLLGQSFGLSSGTVFWVVHWYEILLFLSIAIVFLQCITRRRCLNFKLLYQPALYFLLLSAISALLFASSLSRGIEGFRFTALPVLFLLLSQFSLFSTKERNQLVRTYLIMALVVALWGLIERFLPINYWATLGLNDFGWGKYEIVKYYYQSASLLDGPNQLSSYLLPAIFIILDRIFRSKPKLEVNKLPALILKLLMLAIFIAALIFTFSRSSLVALFVAFIAFIIFGSIGKKTKITLFSIVAIALLAIVLIVKANPDRYQALIYHGASQTGHSQALDQSWQEIKNRSLDKLILGGGIGTAGPAALKYGDGIVSESWYLQLVLELGLVGLIIWIWLIVDLAMKLWRRGNGGLLYGLLALSISALFLHTWADNPAISISIFLLVGLNIFSKEALITKPE